MKDDYSIIGKIMATYPVISEADQQVLDEWMQQEGNREIFESIVEHDNRLQDLKRYVQLENETAAARERFQTLIDVQAEERTSTSFKWRYMAAAAVMLIVVSLVFYVYNRSHKDDVVKESPAVVQQNDVAPGQYKASLTLADGSVVAVDSFFNGKLVQQGNTNVYNKNGQLVYKEEKKGGAVIYNKLTTSKGEMYGTILSDGSKVWLNSQSSIKYPVTFVDDKRKVEITGEAYFEVASLTGQKGKRPFIVTIDGMEVEVLGTKFNVNGYNNEAQIKTTLLEGKVKVSEGDAEKVLSPGQQAKLEKQTGEINTVDDVDVDEAVAWRYGYFQFNDADLQTVMNQIVRWYDVSVVYEGNVPDKKFWGKISRNNSLSNILTALERYGVHFRIEGKKIIITP
jgi:transmembrane sensor